MAKVKTVLRENRDIKEPLIGIHGLEIWNTPCIPKGWFICLLLSLRWLLGLQLCCWELEHHLSWCKMLKAWYSLINMVHVRKHRTLILRRILIFPEKWNRIILWLMSLDQLTWNLDSKPCIFFKLSPSI